MGMFDKFKRNKPGSSDAAFGDDVPDVQGAPATFAEASSAALKNQKSARASREADNNSEVGNEGVPSVNRAKGGNKLVNILVAVSAALIAGALLVAVNVDKGPKKKKDVQAQIQNTLPPLVVPVAPAPIVTVADPVIEANATGAQVPAIKPGMPGTQPIGLKGGKPGASAQTGTSSPAAKPILDWAERKMGGTLLLPEQKNTGASLLKPAPAESDAPPSLFAPGRPVGGGNELGARLEPTATKGVAATMLADRNFLLTKGTSLDCALETALDSTIPGLTTCRLTRDIYSDNGQILLLDRGSQLVGEYQGGLKQGQTRLFVLWTRVKTPNGVVVALNSPGTDSLGRSGMEGWVDNHFLERFGAAILMSFIQGTVASISKSGGSSGTTNIYGTTASSGEKVIEKILEASVGIPPTMVKNQGDHIQVMVARDLDFSSVYSLRVKQ